MQHKRAPVPVIVVLLLVLLVGGYYGLQALFDEKDGELQASGTIEAVDVRVSPETAGKVTERAAQPSRSSKWIHHLHLAIIACWLNERSNFFINWIGDRWYARPPRVR